jgi:hypothetical protein
MTKRLQEAIKRLTPEQIEQLTRYAELFVKDSDVEGAMKPTFQWVGSLNGVYGSGLEAQEAAKQLRIKLTDRSMSS